MATEFSKMSDQQLETWIRNHSEDNRGAPEFWYVEDVDNALTLIDRAVWNVSMHMGYEMDEAELDDLSKSYRARAKPGKLARAICECWAVMREAEDDNA